MSVQFKRFVGQDRAMLRRALRCAIDWNRSLIEAHTPTVKYRGRGTNPHAAWIRVWRSEIKSWTRLHRKLSNTLMSDKAREQ